MSVTERTYRLRIRNAADDAWEHTFTKFAKPPVVGGQRVYPLQGKTTSKPWVCELVDNSLDITAALAEEIGGDTSHWRYTLLRRKADVSVADDGGAYTVLATARISNIELTENQGAYRISLEDERHIERNTEIFLYSNTTTVWPPGTNLSAGFYAHGHNILLAVTELAYSGPVSALRFDKGSRRWSGNVQTAINGDVKDDGRTTITPGQVVDGSFKNLRLHVGGNDYEVLAFAYETVNLHGGVTGNFNSTYPIPIGNKPAHDDDPVGVFVIDSAHALSGTAYAAAYLYFGRVGYTGTKDDPDDPEVPQIDPTTSGITIEGSAPTEDVPLHVEGNAWSVLADIYDGLYGGEVVAYDATQMAALQADDRFPPGMAWRVTGSENMAKWVEQNIYKPLCCVPLISAAGEVYPQPLLLPDSGDIPDVSTLDVLSAANVTAPVTWRHESQDQITRISFAVPHRQTERYILYSGWDENYGGSLDRWKAGTGTRSFDSRIDEFGIMETVIDLPTVYPETGPPDNTSGTHSFAETHASEWLNRFGDGPVYYRAECLASVTAVVGDYVVIDCDTLHTPNAGIRSESRLVQVISRSVTVAGVTLELLDAGPFLNALTDPSVAITQNANDPKHTIRVVLSNLGGWPYELQMARTTATDWYAIASGTAATVDVGGLRSGTTFYARARAIGPQRIRSGWCTRDAVSTQFYPPPTSVSATASNNSIALTWTNGSDLPTEVWYDTVTPLDVDTATPWETYPTDTTGCTIDALDTTTLYYCFVRHRGPYGGYSFVASDSDTTGAGENTLTAPDELYIELGSSYGTRTSP